MADPEYDRILSQLRLAMVSDCGCEDRLSSAQDAARGAGLSAAEIDAALGERSFDVRTSAVLAVACALKNGDLQAYDMAEKQALACGLTGDELEFFMTFALRFREIPKDSIGA
ncbi:hypothetical protein [Aurantiacibacter odishensis]|uniref:hypothetical protein n=1 Tax=Aurantiacibacter odishensis TaxID=1155476 RepID=UPI000E765EEF|nr:hypothetical protein [Aurantiacibacter odishensis]